MSYGIGQPALDDISFEIDPGQFVIISGKSGAGKTTLARLLIRELEPTSGTITFDGQDVSQIKKSKLYLHRRHIAVIYQDYKLLYDLTVKENIALALQIVGKEKAEIESRIEDLLQLVQLSEKGDLFPGQLSGGEIQRVSIARALANAPEVLFADEPTGNLDRETGLHIVQILKKINALGTTVLMSTHEQFDFSDHPHMTFELSKGHLTVKEGKVNKTEPETKETKKDPEITESPEVEQPDAQELSKEKTDSKIKKDK